MGPVDLEVFFRFYNRIPVYTGSKDTRSVYNFLDQIERMASAVKLEDSTKLFVAKKRLKEELLDNDLVLDNAKSFEEFKQELVFHFGWRNKPKEVANINQQKLITDPKEVQNEETLAEANVVAPDVIKLEEPVELAADQDEKTVQGNVEELRNDVAKPDMEDEMKSECVNEMRSENVDEIEVENMEVNVIVEDDRVSTETSENYVEEKSDDETDGSLEVMNCMEIEESVSGETQDSGEAENSMIQKPIEQPADLPEQAKSVACAPQEISQSHREENFDKHSEGKESKRKEINVNVKERYDMVSIKLDALVRKAENVRYKRKSKPKSSNRVDDIKEQKGSRRKTQRKERQKGLQRRKAKHKTQSIKQSIGKQNEGICETENCPRKGKSRIHEYPHKHLKMQTRMSPNMSYWKRSKEKCQEKTYRKRRKRHESKEKIFRFCTKPSVYESAVCIIMARKRKCCGNAAFRRRKKKKC